MGEFLRDFTERAKREGLVINYVKVLRGGEVVDEYSRLPTKTRLNSWSVSKSVVSLAAGIARDEGLIRLDERICDAFPEYVPENPSPNLTDIRLTDMLTMTTGLKSPLYFADDPERYTTKDWIKPFFDAEFTKRPGEQFLYSNFNTFVLSCLIEKRAGTNLLYYLWDRLLEPIGIGNPEWTLDPNGHVHAANGLYLTIDEMANIGQLLLQKGEWKGKQLVPADYIEEATGQRTMIPGPPGSYARDIWNGYGYFFWINPDGSYRADGKLGQYIMVLPEKDAVIATMSLEGKSIFSAVWEEIAQKL